MKTTTGYWRDWWNDFARRSSVDREADRGTSLKIDALEQEARRQFLAAIDPRPADVVLDAGCGTGVNFGILSGRVARIVGMDLSEEMLKRAERRIVAEGLQNVALQHGSVTAIEHPDGTFDKVICTSVLQYLNDEECRNGIREMVRVAKDGATLVIHLKNRTSLYGVTLRVLKIVGRMMGRKTIPDHYRPRAWYERVVNEAGGSIVDYDSFEIFTMAKLPRSVVRRLLQLEMRWARAKWIRKFGVNYKMTVKIAKSGDRGIAGRQTAVGHPGS